LETLDALDWLRINPGWASLPLFDRSEWTRARFGDFAESINEHVDPSDAAEKIYVGLDDLDSSNLHIRRWWEGSDVIGAKLHFNKQVRFPDWQRTSQGERLVQRELRKTLLKYKLHTDQELFDKAYSYIRQYY